MQQFKIGDMIAVQSNEQDVLNGIKGIIEEIQVGYAMVITEPKYRDKIGAFFWVNLEKCQNITENP